MASTEAPVVAEHADRRRRVSVLGRGDLAGLSDNRFIDVRRRADHQVPGD